MFRNDYKYFIKIVRRDSLVREAIESNGVKDTNRYKGIVVQREQFALSNGILAKTGSLTLDGLRMNSFTTP